MRFVKRGGYVLDTETLLEWSPGVSGEMDWGKAKEYAFTLGCRLPSVKEFLGIISYDRYLPAFVKEHVFEGVPKVLCWTGDEDVQFPEYAWFVGIGSGMVDTKRKNEKCHVWPVR